VKPFEIIPAVTFEEEEEEEEEMNDFELRYQFE
jgi:hypothetical protein